MRTAQTAAPTATSAAVIDPTPIAQRGPHASAIQPTSGEPTGVAPRNTIM
ncbi:Uncharacterised protein [Mycobacteroides abscessus]|nr:Uncharacterised protein [Mycobacteroides abscessus]